MFPKNNSTIQSPFQPRIFLHYKINGSSFDSVKRFSINIYWKEENQSFPKTKGELSVKGSLKWEKKLTFPETLFVPKHCYKCFIILILMPTPILMLTNTDTDIDNNVDINTSTNTNTNTDTIYQYQ